MANCYACKAEIVFDNEHVGRNGKKIPLDPATKQPHDCPMREKPFTGSVAGKQQSPDEDKNDHGNEEEAGVKWAHPKLEYVDHTLKGQSKVKIFVSENVDELQQLYNQFLKIKNGEIKTQGAQFQMNSSEMAIALYYEEVKA